MCTLSTKISQGYRWCVVGNDGKESFPPCPLCSAHCFSSHTKGPRHKNWGVGQFVTWDSRSWKCRCSCEGYGLHVEVNILSFICAGSHKMSYFPPSLLFVCYLPLFTWCGPKGMLFLLSILEYYGF